jgi:predicted transcriptional regulator
MRRASHKSNAQRPMRLVFALPTPLRLKVEELAAKNERSISGEIRVALYEYVDRQEAEVA